MNVNDSNLFDFFKPDDTIMVCYLENLYIIAWICSGMLTLLLIKKFHLNVISEEYFMTNGPGRKSWNQKKTVDALQFL